MDGNIATGCMFLLSLVVFTQGQAAGYNHVYLGYVAPFNFIKAFSANAQPYLYHILRNKRSSMPAHRSYNPMPYSFDYGFNPMMGYHPFDMFHPIMNFPRFNFPFMSAFPYYSPSRMLNNERRRTGYQNVEPQNAYGPSDPFGSHFMKMMGFDFDHEPTFPKMHVNNHGNNYNSGYDYGNSKQSASGNGKSYESSYSKSYSMNTANGKGHMVMKDSSYVNNNGQVEMHNDPARHYSMNAEGTFVPDNSYNKH